MDIKERIKHIEEELEKIKREFKEEEIQKNFSKTMQRILVLKTAFIEANIVPNTVCLSRDVIEKSFPDCNANKPVNNLLGLDVRIIIGAYDYVGMEGTVKCEQ